jgi:hypothetical protein
MVFSGSAGLAGNLLWRIAWGRAARVMPKAHKKAAIGAAVPRTGALNWLPTLAL